MNITKEDSINFLKYLIDTNIRSQKSQFTGGDYSKGEVLILLRETLKNMSGTSEKWIKRQNNINNNLPPRHGFKWSDDEYDTLIEECYSGFSLEEIIALHERSRGGITSKIPNKLKYLYSEYDYDLVKEELAPHFDDSLLRF
jgi:hypothetical protein